MCDITEETYAMLHRINHTANWTALDLWLATCDQSEEVAHSQALATWMLDNKQKDVRKIKAALSVNEYGQGLIHRAIAIINNESEAIAQTLSAEPTATMRTELRLSTCAQIAYFLYGQWEDTGCSQPFTEWLRDVMQQEGDVVLVPEGDRHES